MSQLNISIDAKNVNLMYDEFFCNVTYITDEGLRFTSMIRLLYMMVSWRRCHCV